MKYMMMMNVAGGPYRINDWPREAWTAHIAFMKSFARKLSAAGVLSTVTTMIVAPVSLAADSQGRIYVGDASTGSVFRLDGSTNPKLIAKSDSRTVVLKSTSSS